MGLIYFRFRCIMVLFRGERIIQVALQDKSRRRGIIPGAPVGLPDFLHDAFGQNRGKSLISELNRKVGMALQFRNEVTDLFGLGTQAAIHGERQADDNPPDVIFTGNIDNRFYICRAVLPRNNGQRTGQNAKRVA